MMLCYNGFSRYVSCLTRFISSPTFIIDPSVSAMSSDKTHEMLEEENDQLMDEMAHKIHTLKTVSTNTLYEVTCEMQSVCWFHAAIN